MVQESPEWDKKVLNLQVIETDRDSVTVPALMSARNSPIAWELCCEVRVSMLEWLQREYHASLPRSRTQLHLMPDAAAIMIPQNIKQAARG
jgi:hypothetical protein